MRDVSSYLLVRHRLAEGEPDPDDAVVLVELRAGLPIHSGPRTAGT